METKHIKLTPTVQQSILDAAIAIAKNCTAHCRDFKILTSHEYPNTLILGWTHIDLGADHTSAMQSYRYRCFNTDGSPQACEIHYSNQREANTFYEGLQTLYKQTFAIDHKL